MDKKQVRKNNQNSGDNQVKSNRTKGRKLTWIIVLEIMLIVILIGSYFIYSNFKNRNNDNDKIADKNSPTPVVENKDEEEKLSPAELEAKMEQERIKRENEERQTLIVEAEKLTIGYDYDGAIELIKTYQGPEGGYDVYPVLKSAIDSLTAQKDSLKLYGGSYTSPTQFNHVFFHSLIADTSKAFDGDYDNAGYNMYMTTVTEFKNMMESMYNDGYVLVRIHDIVKEVTGDDGSTKFVPGDIYLPEGKKPFVLSQDDVNYYDYMDGDGFASRVVIDENGKPTTEMLLEDGSSVVGPYDVVSVLNEFIEEHPDFSYKGAKGILAITGYEGALGYRTDDPESPTYEEDKETVRKVAQALRDDGWELASHSWGHRNMQTNSMSLFKTDADRWEEEVGSLLGPIDIIIFPYGVDFETTMGHYKSERYHYLKEKGFKFYCGVDSKPWMHIKDEYIRMTRRPLDGQAMLEFPKRLEDLFDLSTIIDPERPARNW